MHLDEYLFLKCSRGTLYPWDGFGKTFSSYNGMLMHTNNSIIIFILTIFWFEFEVLLYTYARAYILHMFGNILFTDLSGTHVSLFYLPLLEDFQSIPLYSRDSGVSACLYRHLCQVNLEKSKQVGGYLLLLQIK
jgi:hypothetical protein